ncbi:hypothetical protein [Streptomyces alfalfae]
MSAPAPALTTADPAALAERLRAPVWSALWERADALRRALPDRPADPHGRWQWLRSLDPAQARQAALLDHLDALCLHLAGRHALGYRADDPLPEAALDAADGFTSLHTAQLIAAYRQACGRRAKASPGTGRSKVL